MEYWYWRQNVWLRALTVPYNFDHHLFKMTPSGTSGTHSRPSETVQLTKFCIKTCCRKSQKICLSVPNIWSKLPVKVTCASFSFSLFRCIISWLTSPRSVAPVDYSFAQLLVNLRRHDRDMSHFGCFARMFGRDKQMFCDSQLQVFMQNSVVFGLLHKPL